jgi:hypothetical protein
MDLTMDEGLKKEDYLGHWKIRDFYESRIYKQDEKQKSFRE